MSKDIDYALHQQESDLEIIKLLSPLVKNKTFLDIGAEKGTFTELLTSLGLTGILFEPLPKHEPILKKLAEETNCIFSNFAIDEKDGTAEFHIASDSEGNTLDFFHSLHRLNDDQRIHHKQSISVTCRSLNSLYHEGFIKKNIGILKTDTEGNDLHVLRGLSEIDAEVIVCEYFMPGIYAGWEQGSPYALIEEAKKLGFEHYITTKRIDMFEFVSIDTKTFLEKQWGNLVFINNELFEKIKPELENLSAKQEVNLITSFYDYTNQLQNEITTLRQVCQERVDLINKLHKECALTKEINFKSLTELKEKDEIIENLRLHRTDHETSFVTAINKHFEEFYLRFEKVQKEIFKTTKESIDLMHEQYNYIVQDRVNFIDPMGRILKKYKCQENKNSLRNKLKKRIELFFSPKLGELNLYQPRPIKIPARYNKIISNEKLPRISIVTPSYFHGNFIERTIKSVIEQNYPQLEYIIQDGKSTDNTVEILKKYQSSFKHWESVNDNGQSDAINLGFRHTTGEIMAYLNSDDILLPGALHYIGDYFTKHPEVDVIYGHRVLMDENDQEIGRWILPPHSSDILSWADYIPQETLFWRRRIWEKVGGKIDESFQFAMDWDLLLRFREAGAKFVRLPRFLGAFRVHQHQKTSSQISHTGMEEMKRLREKCLGRNVCHNEINKKVKSYFNRHLVYHKLYRAGVLRY